MKWNPQIAAMVFWTAIIISFVVWLFIRAFKRSSDRGGLFFKWLVTIPLIGGYVYILMPMVRGGGYGAVGGILLAVVFGNIMYLVWRNSIMDLVANPLASLYDGGREEIEPKPYYSIALARRKTNHPLEAIVAIREQLAKFPNDFEGVLLLANIQAEDLADLPGAEITLDKFCNSPGAPDRQVVAALTQLADWHLKKTVDADAARAALQKITARFPGTEFALRAEQRLAHLGGAEKVLLGQHDRQAMPVPEGVDNIGLLDSTAFLQPKEIEPGKLAAAYVKHLEQHPHDSEVREKLAAIYARDFKRLDLASLELAQLINEPRHSPRQIAGWLNQLANFQIELGAEVATVTATLEKIVELFPDLPVADQARRRLVRVGPEIKALKETPAIKPGVYEQNIGLKYGRPGSR